MSRILVIQHVAAEPLGTLDPLIRARGHRIRYVNFERDPTAQPTLDGYHGLIVLGGPMNVEDHTRLPHLLTEMRLIEQALAQDKPVLGICRGMQLINVAFGGSLHQDLIADGVTTHPHADLPRYDDHHHALELSPGGVLSRWHGGATCGQVTSIHHQGVARLAEGFVPVARAPDGVIEAIWRQAPGFVLGVQWHPEFHDGRDPSLLDADPMMRAFLDAARARRGAG